MSKELSLKCTLELFKCNKHLYNNIETKTQTKTGYPTAKEKKKDLIEQ